MSRYFDSESRARRLARKAGLVMTRTRRPRSPSNLGEFCLLDEQTNCPVYGHRYDRTPDEIIAWIGVRCVEHHELHSDNQEYDY
jgi:hypothetical protein